MVKSIIYSLLLWFCQILSFGQVVIEGRLETADNKPLSGINVLAYNKDRRNILAYTFSDEKGAFKIEVKCLDNYLIIATKSLAYKDTSILLSNNNQHIELVLSEHFNEIKEIDVRGYPISARGDTIIYTVKSFAQEKDLSIGDVIKRMPGFEVNQNGQISYQGQPIQKYYIEGLDLLEQRYNIANRNLPHQAVSAVEIMQNHQPIKMLEDKLGSEATSLNIRLDKKIAITGTMYAGAGLSPILEDINITPMLFAKRQQIIASTQYNNIGTDLNTQHQPLEFKMGELEGLTNKKEVLVGISSAITPQIENYRFLDNHALLLSYNHLLKLNNETELKINSSYYNDRINENVIINTTYFTENETFKIQELMENTFFNNSLSTELTLSQNTKKRYLQNKLIFNGYWDDESGIIQTTKTLEQSAKTPHLSLANEFDSYLHLKRNFLRLYSFIDYNNSPQKISFLPGIFENELNNRVSYQETTQNYSKNNIISHNFLQLAIKRGNWILENEPGIKFEKQHIETSIEIDKLKLNIDSFCNQLDWNYYEFYLNERIKYETSSFKINLEMPIHEIIFDIKDTYHQSPSEIQRLLFTPSLSLDKEIGNFWSVKIGLNYLTSIGEPDNLMQGYIINSYQQINRKADKLSENQGYSYIIGIKYKNPISGFFSNLTWFSSHSTNNVLIQYKINGEGLWYYNTIEKENIVQSDNLSTSIGKYLSKIHTTIEINGAYTRRLKDYLSNDIQSTNDMQFFLIAPRLSISKWKFLDVEYSYQYQLINQNSIETDISFENQIHKGSIFVNFSKSHQLGLVCEYYRSASEQHNESETFFSDLSYFYKPLKSKFRFRFKCTNIFNQSEFVTHYNSEISLTRSSFQIRPRQFMFTLFYNL